MENMSKEVVQSVTDYFSCDGMEGIELTKDILYYLYHTTKDDRLKEVITEWYNSENYCIECGSKMEEVYKCEYCDKKES